MGFAALALAYVYSQFYRSFLAVVAPRLGADLGASAADLSTASGAWFAAFALTQFGVGVGLDRHGPRRTAGWTFAVFGAGGAALFAAARTPGTLIVAMVALGIGCAPVLMAAFYLFARRFEPARFAVLASFWVAFGNLGNVLGASPLVAAVEAFGWRAAMLGLAAGNLVVGIGILSLVRDGFGNARTAPLAAAPLAVVPPAVTPPAVTPSAAAPSGAAPSGLAGYLALLRLRALLLVLPMALLCYAPVAGLRGLWAGPWLADVHGADAATIGRVTLAMAVAMIVGSALYGPLDRRFDTRKRVVAGGNLVVLVALGTLALWPAPGIGVAAALLVTVGLAGMSFGVVMAHGRAFVPQPLLGRGVTLLNFCSIAGAGALQFACAGLVAADTEAPAAEVYGALFGVYAASLAVALAIYARSRDAPPSRDGSPLSA